MEAENTHLDEIRFKYTNLKLHQNVNEKLPYIVATVK